MTLPETKQEFNNLLHSMEHRERFVFRAGIIVVECYTTYSWQVKKMTVQSKTIDGKKLTGTSLTMNGQLDNTEYINYMYDTIKEKEAA